MVGRIAVGRGQAGSLSYIGGKHERGFSTAWSRRREPGGQGQRAMGGENPGGEQERAVGAGAEVVGWRIEAGSGGAPGGRCATMWKDGTCGGRARSPNEPLLRALFPTACVLALVSDRETRLGCAVRWMGEGRRHRGSDALPMKVRLRDLVADV